MEKSTMHFLLARFMDTEYQTELLANVSTESFGKIKQLMFERFNDCDMIELTDYDIKEAWKAWFDWAANNGTLLYHGFQIDDPDESCRHHEIRVIDLILSLAYDNIDRL